MQKIPRTTWDETRGDKVPQNRKVSHPDLGRDGEQRLRISNSSDTTRKKVLIAP